MSHVSLLSGVNILSLPALARAAKRLGLEFVEGQETYAWYGEHVGDWPLPEGFDVADMGRCQHAIRIPGNAEAWEIGVVANRDGREGYSLIYDFYEGGHGIEALAGRELDILFQEYSYAIAEEEMSTEFQITRTELPDGTLRLEMERW